MIGGYIHPPTSKDCSKLVLFFVLSQSLSQFFQVFVFFSIFCIKKAENNCRYMKKN